MMSINVGNNDKPIIEGEGSASAANDAEIPGSNGNEETAGTSKRVWHKAKKRSAEPLSETEAAELQLKRIRQRLATTPRSAINALLVLNEYRKGLACEVVCQSGPIHNPLYTVRLIIDDQAYEGVGTSKKNAKLVAAEAALHALFGDVLPPPDVVAASSEACVNQTAENVADTLETGVHGMNPTIVLNRLRPGTAYDDIESLPTDTVSDSATARSYRVSCVVDGMMYHGAGLNKKMAKARAAADALEKVFGLLCTQTASGFPLFVGELPPPPPKRKSSEAKPRTAAAELAKPPQLLCSLPGEKHPAMFIHELYPSTDCTVSESPDEQGLFHASLSVEDKTFEAVGSSKKAARTAAAISAVNYLHETGYLNIRIAEKASSKKPKWQPRPRQQFSQNNFASTPTRGGFAGWRGRGRGRGGAGYGTSYSSLKSTYAADGSKDASWVSGGVLKAGDFIGVSSASVAAGDIQYGVHQDYAQQTSYISDDSYTTADNSFGVTSPYNQQYGGFKKGSPATQGFSSFGSPAPVSGSFGKQKVTRGGMASARGNANAGTSGGRGRGRGLGQMSSASGTQFSKTTPSSSYGAGQMKTTASVMQVSTTKPSGSFGAVQSKTGTGGGAVDGTPVKKLMKSTYSGSSTSYGSGFGRGKSSDANVSSNIVGATAGKKTGAVSSNQASEYGVADARSGGSLHGVAYAGYDYDYGQAFVGGDSAGYSETGENHTASNYANYGDYYSQYEYDAPDYGNYGTQ